jgi:hypothetical protein
MAGVGGRRVLTAAARFADIVGISMHSKPDGSGLDPDSAGLDMLIRQVKWVEQASSNRPVPPERNFLLQAAFIGPKSTMTRKAAETFGISEEFASHTPHLVIGSEPEVAEMLIAARENFGITYLAVFEQYAEDFASVMSLLKS